MNIKTLVSKRNSNHYQVMSLRIFFLRLSQFCAVSAFLIFGLVLSGSLTANAVTINEFPIPTTNSWPYFITAGPDGNLWFTEYLGDKIGRITPAGVITEFPIPTPNSAPSGITAGPDGNLWFAERSGNRIGRITPAGVITEFFIPTGGCAPQGITVGPDGNLWFAEESGDKIGRITTAGVITEFPLPTGGSWPLVITAGPDGNLWFTESGSDKIGRITPAGVITEFPLPTPVSYPLGITAGPDGNLWFTESSGNRIGRITTAGVITEFPIPTPNSDPDGITVGPDGNLWFTEVLGNNIGRLTPCTFTINPVQLFAPHTGDTGYTVSVMTSNSSCTWTAATGDSWITITGGSSGTGNGIVTYSLANNPWPGSARSGIITIAGQTHTVLQGDNTIEEQITQAPSTVNPGAPIWVKATFTNNTGNTIVTIKPDCCNTYFWVTDAWGNMVRPLDRICLPYGIPDSVTSIPAGSQFDVICDVSERYQLTSGNYNIIATYANYIMDPHYNPVTKQCSIYDRIQCYDLWNGAAGSAKTPITVSGGTTVQRVASISFEPSAWDTQWTSPPVTAYISNIEGHSVSDVDPSTIRLNGTVPIMGPAIIVGDVLKVEFDGGQAVQSLGTAVPWTSVYPTVQGGFYSTSSEIFSGSARVDLYSDLSDITLTQPNGGEVIPSGSTYSIIWLGTPAAVKYDLGYRCTPGTWILIASDVAGSPFTSYYNWTVPTPLKNEGDCRVGVRGRNALDWVVGMDTSDNPFSIEVVKVLYPNGGEILSGGCTTVNIRWRTNGTASPVDKTLIYGSGNGGATWKLIATRPGNTGLYVWTTPWVTSPKTNCKIGVVLKDASGNTLGWDISDANFTIYP